MPTEPRQKLVIARAERNDGPWVNPLCVLGGTQRSRAKGTERLFWYLRAPTATSHYRVALFCRAGAVHIAHTEFGGILVCILG